MPKRDWRLIQTTRETPCRICGIEGRTERAHVIGRRADRPVLLSPEIGKTKVLVVHPDSIVPLCGPTGDSHACHTQYDAGELDLLPYLTLKEQVRAVEDAGGLELARRRTAPLDYHRVIEEARKNVHDTHETTHPEEES
jgi:hypothetical protein